MRTVLVIGSGAREHALAVTLAASPHVSRVVVCPGHALFEPCPGPWLAPDGTPIVNAALADDLGDSPEGYAEVARRVGAVLSVVGPEAPLAAGIVDHFEGAKLAIFGPSRAASEIETSKTFAKALLNRAGVATPRASVITSLREAARALSYFPPRVVIKASGLAGGKGAFICDNHTEALGRIWRLIEGEELGDAGASVIIEDFVVGEEASVMAICDRTQCVVLPAVRDFKRAGDDDTGSNTGGMGALCPVPGYDQAALDKLKSTIFLPTLHALAEAGRPFSGVLYAGILRSGDTTYVLEFNARFGDPETQVLMPLMKSDLFELLESVVKKNLAAYLAANPVAFHSGASVGVVLAAPGYPEAPVHGRPLSRELLVPPAPLRAFATNIELPAVEPDEDADEDEPRPPLTEVPPTFVNGGGRTVTIVATAPDVRQARSLVYDYLERHAPVDYFYRRDIAARPDAYARAGVNIDLAQHVVEGLRAEIEGTYSEAVLSKLGDYAGLFDLNVAAQLRDPVLVASTDGLGTKSLVAAAAGRTGSLGADLVHHCINDILVSGARPLFFLDQVAVNAIRPGQVRPILAGIAEACKVHGIALIGGETAEMPGVFRTGAVDVSGTIVGVVERDARIDGTRIAEGDVVLGLPSSGLHTNGFSLVRSMFSAAELAGTVPGTDTPWLDALLTPHRSYLTDFDALIAAGVQPSGLVHITGGGFTDNPGRVLPAALALELDAWALSPLFAALKKRGRLSQLELRRIFNLGIGMLVVVPAAALEAACAAVPALTRLGQVVTRAEGGEAVIWHGEHA